MKPLYIVAVSGGVDSIVLLHRLVATNDARLIIAHVDHGIRQGSGEDARFVAQRASDYGLPFESVELRLGSEASEQQAREGRWKFLRDIKQKYQADNIVTAHHADDVVETMIINLKRGTGWRGIATLRETNEIKRPLLGMRKQDILAYAKDHGLEWCEDATNADERYLRNYVRRNIIPRMSGQRFNELMLLHTRQLEIREGIEGEVTSLSPTLRRYNYIMWPDAVAREMLRNCVGSLTRRELDQALLFVRTARVAKKLLLSNDAVLKMEAKQFIVSRGEDC